jgi:hypothetical protein
MRKEEKDAEQIIKKAFYFNGNRKTCREIISPNVFIAIISVCDAQVVPDILYRWLCPAESAVVFQE